MVSPCPSHGGLFVRALLVVWPYSSPGEDRTWVVRSGTKGVAAVAEHVGMLYTVYCIDYAETPTCVCVCFFFFPFILDIKFVGRTSRGHTQEEGHIGFFISTFLVRCVRLKFSREKDSAIPFPRRP